MRPGCRGAARPEEGSRQRTSGSIPEKEEHTMNRTEEDGVNHVSEQTFDQEVIGSESPVLVDFWAPWCGPCKQIGPVLEQLASRYRGRMSVAKVNVDENAGVASRYGVRSIPALMLFKQGKMVASLVGARPLEDLERFVDAWV
jgi:thioredoxin 1